MAHHTKGTPSRTALKREALAAAATIQPPRTCDVCIIGGGAAGLSAAITAAEMGARVVVLERDVSCGRTILATGNGRCNFCNEDLDPHRYNDPPFVSSVCGSHHKDDVLTFFAGCGLAWTSEDGRFYPLSRQAASVRNVLLARARRSGVTLAPAREVIDVKTGNSLFTLEAKELFGSATKERQMGASAVILATGGGACVYESRLGLKIRKRQPMLCSLTCGTSPLQTLDGRRAHVLATLWHKGQNLYQEAGEVLFRSYGLSGIVVFDLSRRALPGDTITLDLLPNTTDERAHDLISIAGGSLDGLLDPVIASEVNELAQHHWWPSNCCAEAPTSRTPAEYALDLIRRLPFVVEGIADPLHAQVQRGGFANYQFHTSTLECTKVAGLFACGEALDVDGDCGGYNLAWAWKSGIVAGKAAASYAAHTTTKKGLGF